MRQVVLGLIAVGLVWTVGLGAFIKAVPRPGVGAPEAADGVIVFTGGGGARISAAMTLFADGAGKRLLISGVNPETSKDRLAQFWSGAPDMFECCVDLGREARSTEGNAAEAAEWARTHDFQKVVLVTSDYHMPRAIAVTKARMPGAQITPYAISSGYFSRSGWPTSPDAWRRVAGEYGKYLLARVRALFAFLSA